MSNNKSNNQEQIGYGAGASQDASRPVEMLELFAEELPEQQDSIFIATASCLSTAGSVGSTASSLSTASTLSD